eukprot:756974-Hanusia_phi.AAC.1
MFHSYGPGTGSSSYLDINKDVTFEVLVKEFSIDCPVKGKLCKPGSCVSTDREAGSLSLRDAQSAKERASGHKYRTWTREVDNTLQGGQDANKENQCTERIYAIVQVLPRDDQKQQATFGKMQCDLRISCSTPGKSEEVISPGTPGCLRFIGAFKPSLHVTCSSGELKISGRPTGWFQGQGFHITAYSFPKRYVQEMYRRSNLTGICRLACRIGALLEDFPSQLAPARQNVTRYRYCKEALGNQLMNVSTTQGYEGVVEQLARIALVFFQRIPKISVDLKSMLQLDCPQMEYFNTTKNASKSSDFIDFQA